MNNAKFTANKLILFIFPALFAFSVIFFARPAKAALSETITLSPGWNVISTPRVLDNHQFSASEVSANFDIFILNSSSTSGWSTMADLGQTEFVPLFGYFVNNKTGINQILTLNFKPAPSPGERIFERRFSRTGWYSIGVANPTYVKTKLSPAIDNNNPSLVLESISGFLTSITDFTSSDYPTNAASVRVGPTWTSVAAADLNSLNDLRETKGYAVYLLNTNALLSGFQNIDFTPSISGTNPTSVGAGSGAFALTITGSNFTPSSTVYWNNQSRVTIYNSSTQIQASILAADIATATTSLIRVINPGVNGGTSTPFGFTPNSAPALRVTTLNVPPIQNVVVGSTSTLLAVLELNSGAVFSGENVRVTRLTITDTLTGGAAASEINNLIIYNGSGNRLTATTTKPNATSTQFVFANPIIIPRDGAETLSVTGNVVSRTASGTHTFSIINRNNVIANGASTSVAVVPTIGPGSGQPVSIIASGSMLISKLVGSSATPDSDQLISVGQTDMPVLAFTLTASDEPIKLTKLTLTASGTARVLDISQIKLYKDGDNAPFKVIDYTNAIVNGNSLVYTISDANNILPTAVQPGMPMSIFVRVSVTLPGPVIGSSFSFNIASSTDLSAVGSLSGQSISASGILPAALGRTVITPFKVAISGDTPMGAVQMQPINVGTELARVLITNNGFVTSTIAKIKFTDGGVHTGNSTGYALTFSDQNSSNYTANNLPIPATESLDFTNLDIAIGPGSSRYFTLVVNNIGSANTGDTFQMSVANLGDVLFTVKEIDLGYDTNLNGNLNDTSVPIFADGVVNFATLIKL